MKPNNWISIQVRRDLLAGIKSIMVSDAAKAAGLSNTTRFIDVAIREKLGRFRQKHLSHVNMYNDHVKIMDRSIDDVGRIVSVYFGEGTFPHCDYCGGNDCVHVRYAWSIPGVRSVLMSRGIKPPMNLSI